MLTTMMPLLCDTAMVKHKKIGVRRNGSEVGLLSMPSRIIAFVPTSAVYLMCKPASPNIGHDTVVRHSHRLE